MIQEKSLSLRMVKSLFLLLFVSFPLCQSTTTIYISPSGSDTSGDGSESNPFQTIQKGVDQSQNGETISLEAGVYSKKQNNPTINTNLSFVSTSGFGTAIILGQEGSSCFSLQNDCLLFELYSLVLDGCDTAFSVQESSNLHQINIVNSLIKNSNIVANVAVGRLNLTDTKISNIQQYLLFSNGLISLHANNASFLNILSDFQSYEAILIESSYFDQSNFSTYVTPSLVFLDTKFVNSTLQIYGSNAFMRNVLFDGAQDSSIYLSDTPLNLSSSVFSHNSSPLNGGAIYISHQSSVYATNSFFYGNAAQNGGAIYCDRGYLTVKSSTFIDNIASGSGGAIGCGICEFVDEGHDNYYRNQEGSPSTCGGKNN